MAQPPLNALRVFEAVARHGSFRRAADELCVTQSAVSHQVRHLEEWLGGPLFDREGNRPRLRPHGEDLGRALALALADIDAACREARRAVGPPALTVAVIPSVAICWLIPRLADFQARSPGTELRMLYAIHGKDSDFRDADVAVVTSIALDHTDWLGPDRESIGREKAGIFRAEKPAIVGEPEMPYTIADVAQECGAILQRCGVDWRYAVTENDWSFTDAHGTLAHLPLPQVPQPNAATALAALRASGLNVSEQAIRDGIERAILPGRFQIVSESPRVIFDVAHNPHAAEYLTGRLKKLVKSGRVLAVIGMLHDKDIAGTLAWLKSVVDVWYCAPLEGPRGATAEQLLEHLGKGNAYDSVAQAWSAALAEAKPEDTVLVCGSFHTVAHVMEVIDVGRSGGE